MFPSSGTGGRTDVLGDGRIRCPGSRASSPVRFCLEGKGWRIVHHREGPVPGGLPGLPFIFPQKPCGHRGRFRRNISCLSPDCIFATE